MTWSFMPSALTSLRLYKVRLENSPAASRRHHHRGRVLFCGKDDIGNFANDALNPERHADTFASDLILQLPSHSTDPEAEESDLGRRT
jgi:hypothetical protein